MVPISRAFSASLGTPWDLGGLGEPEVPFGLYLPSFVLGDSFLWFLPGLVGVSSPVFPFPHFGRLTFLFAKKVA